MGSPAFIKQFQGENLRIRGRWAKAAEDVRPAKLIPLYETLDAVGHTDGLFAAFDLTKVGPHV